MGKLDNYTRTNCRGCDGAGKSYDPTNADKVNVDPRGDRCSACDGKGYRLVLATSLNQPAFQPSTEPIGEMPDWMC